MFTLIIGMIGDEANGWGASHLEPFKIKLDSRLEPPGSHFEPKRF